MGRRGLGRVKKVTHAANSNRIVKEYNNNKKIYNGHIVMNHESEARADKMKQSDWTNFSEPR